MDSLDTYRAMLPHMEWAINNGFDVEDALDNAAGEINMPLDEYGSYAWPLGVRAVFRQRYEVTEGEESTSH